MTTFPAGGEGESRVEDVIRFEPPSGVIGVTGASGFIGRALGAFLTSGGHRVKRFVRRPAASAEEIAWDPLAGRVDREGISDLGAVVHLAGESIFGRWSARKRRRILESRVHGTEALARALATLDRRPSVFISASAVGYYGGRGAERVTEESPSGDGFLAEVCREWEGATRAAEEAGIRTVHLRIGLVLAADGGPLAAMRLPFQLGLGGPVGSGRQGMSWIALDDLLAAVLHAMRTPELKGAVNATAPNPVDNRTFGRTLGRVLRRPAFMPLPAPAVRLLLGAMGRELLLEGAFVEPTRLLATGFRFDFPELEGALRFQLGR